MTGSRLVQEERYTSIHLSQAPQSIFSDLKILSEQDIQELSLVIGDCNCLKLALEKLKKRSVL